MMAGNHLTETSVYSVGSRRGARGTWASPYFQAEARRAEKIFLGDRPPPYLRVWMTPPPPPTIPRSGSGTGLLPSLATKA